MFFLLNRPSRVTPDPPNACVISELRFIGSVLRIIPDKAGVRQLDKRELTTHRLMARKVSWSHVTPKATCVIKHEVKLNSTRQIPLVFLQVFTQQP